MSDALLTLFSFVIVLGSIATLLGATLGINGRSTEAWIAEARAAYSASVGDIEAVSATAQESAGTTVIDVTVENTGGFAYADWDKWDVAVQYTTSTGAVSIQRLSYSATLAAGKWTVVGTYLNAATAEQGVEPDALNPTEQLVVRVQVTPVARSATTGMVVITTQDALSTRIHFDL
ncbi:MAG: hypothetical protein HYY34_01540 [Chloroflexi bacterium]|nr:hypothetical protein [Chloroflexota bacterium]